MTDRWMQLARWMHSYFRIGHYHEKSTGGSATWIITPLFAVEFANAALDPYTGEISTRLRVGFWPNLPRDLGERLFRWEWRWPKIGLGVTTRGGA